MTEMIRTLRPGMRGKDVEAHKRAIARLLGHGLLKSLNAKLPVVRRHFQPSYVLVVKRAQKELGLPQTGVIGPSTHEMLLAGGWFDQKALALYDEAYAADTKEQRAFDRLVAAMKVMSDHTPGYRLGGGHGVQLLHVSPYEKLDCSSSTSKALFEAGLFEGRDQAIVSGLFGQWGEPGPGQMFTVYWNDEHVWVRLHRTRWWRFDTSPHGDGGRGPKLRMLPRFTGGFQARHFRGM